MKTLTTQNTRVTPEALERLRNACDALSDCPFPAAFNEAAVATRAVVRQKRKLKEDYEEELKFLYWLGTTHQLAYGYSHRLEQPSFNVVETVGTKALAELKPDYSQLGYLNFELFNKTDGKWFEEAWGSPESHGNSFHFYREQWYKWEALWVVKTELEHVKRFQETGLGATPFWPNLSGTLKEYLERCENDVRFGLVSDDVQAYWATLKAKLDKFYAEQEASDNQQATDSTDNNAEADEYTGVDYPGQKKQRHWLVTVGKWAFWGLVVLFTPVLFVP